jgi:Family of unknown function (DUF5677)
MPLFRNMPDRETKSDLRTFAKLHNLSRLSDIPFLEHAIASFLRCRTIFEKAFCVAGDHPNLQDPSYAFSWQLLERCAEHVDAALCCLATGCFAGAEALARTAVEAAVTCRYVYARETPLRLASFFQDFILTNEKQCNGWEKSAMLMSDSEKEAQLIGIRKRRQMLNALKPLIETFSSEALRFCEATEIPRWPNRIESRFEEIGELSFYKSTYARLSGQVHPDAENVIAYFLTKMCPDPTAEQKIGLETGSFTLLYVFIAVEHYIKAQMAFLRAYRLMNALPKLEQHEHYVRLLQAAAIDMSGTIDESWRGTNRNPS